MSGLLNKIREQIEDWCYNNDIPISMVCDTVGIQGVKIYDKSKRLNRLFEELSKCSDDIFLDVQKVRGGTIVALSMRALSEQEVETMLQSIEEKRDYMNFADRLSRTFSDDIINIDEELLEDQYKTANMGITRSNQSGRQRNLHGVTMTHGGIVDGKHNRHKKKQLNKGFKSQLSEALEGMATSNDAQPADLFKKFARALSVLGQQMGVGPLQDQLKQQGINWKKSDDGQAIILFVMNAQTQAPQPISRISAETLTNPSDFEKQLLNMVDFAKGEAPGAFEQHQKEMQAQEKAVRDIARSANPDDQEIATQMAGGVQQAPQQTAAEQTAIQAASPKTQVEWRTNKRTAWIDALGNDRHRIVDKFHRDLKKALNQL